MSAQATDAFLIVSALLLAAWKHWRLESRFSRIENLSDPLSL